MKDILFENCPPEMRDLRIWAVWRAVKDGDRVNKLPWRPDGVGKLSWKNSLNWLSFEEAKELFLAGKELPAHKGTHFDGIGFFVPERFSDDPSITVFDLDGVAIKNGTLPDNARLILGRIDSYSELSPSETGIHTISLSGNLKGKSNLGKKDIGGQEIEAFVHMHFVTFTGWRLDEYPTDVKERTKETTALYESLDGVKESKAPAKPIIVDDRARRYAEKALENEIALVRQASTGSRNNTLNAAALKIGRFVPKWISESSAERDLIRAAISVGLDENEARATARSGMKAGMKEPSDPPIREEEMSFADALLLAQDLKDAGKLKEDPGMPYVAKYVRALAVVREKDRAEFERVRASLKKSGCSLKDLKKSLDESTPKEIKQIKIIEEPRAPPNIHDRAIEILTTGNPLCEIANCCGRMVLGAEKAFKKLICCVAVQDVKQSAGLHPKLNGESGGGKTWVILSFAHHLPKEMVIKGSMSSKAGFYHNDGNRVLRILDDYQAGNEDLDTMIKQTSSTFHECYEHRTVVNQAPMVLTIGSEQTWAITSVDSSQDIQVLNRQIPINVNDSECLTREVNQKTIERYGKGEQQFPEDENVEVCREMWRILREEGYINVRVPFWSRIEWLDTSNRRNPSIFMDMLIAQTAMNRFQREKDEDGFYLATEEDFQAAKSLFTDNDAEELVKRLTKREREFAELLLASPAGLTRGQVAEAMNVSVNRITQLANGESGKGGLSQKLPGFEIEDITDTTRMNEEESRSIRKTVYVLKGYNKLSGFDAVVKLHDKDGKDGVSPIVRKPKKEENDKKRERERERDTKSKGDKGKEREKEKNFSSNEKIISRSCPDEKPYSGEETMAVDGKTDLTGKLTEPYGPYTLPTDSEKETLRPDQEAFLERIYSRAKSLGSNPSAFELGIGCKGNGQDIPLKLIKEWLKGESIAKPINTNTHT